jgi:hypothetical protein
MAATNHACRESWPPRFTPVMIGGIRRLGYGSRGFDRRWQWSTPIRYAAQSWCVNWSTTSCRIMTPRVSRRPTNVRPMRWNTSPSGSGGSSTFERLVGFLRHVGVKLAELGRFGDEILVRGAQIFGLHLDRLFERLGAHEPLPCGNRALDRLLRIVGDLGGNGLRALRPRAERRHGVVHAVLAELLHIFGCHVVLPGGLNGHLTGLKLQQPSALKWPCLAANIL